MSLSDDTWYRAPQFHPETAQARRTDIEVLCEIIFAHGERYEDGTAAIGFTWLFKMFNRANIVGILIKAKKHGLVFFDGEIVFAVSLRLTFYYLSYSLLKPRPDQLLVQRTCPRSTGRFCFYCISIFTTQRNVYFCGSDVLKIC